MILISIKIIPNTADCNFRWRPAGVLVSLQASFQSDTRGRLLNDFVWEHGSRKAGWWGKKTGRVLLHVPAETFQDASSENTQDVMLMRTYGQMQKKGWIESSITMNDYTIHVVDVAALECQEFVSCFNFLVVWSVTAC